MDGSKLPFFGLIMQTATNLGWAHRNQHSQPNIRGEWTENSGQTIFYFHEPDDNDPEGTTDNSS